jgi:hypothetical protein
MKTASKTMTMADIEMNRHRMAQVVGTGHAAGRAGITAATIVVILTTGRETIINRHANSVGDSDNEAASMPTIRRGTPIDR